jgi:hypothetical protein
MRLLSYRANNNASDLYTPTIMTGSSWFSSVPSNCTWQLGHERFVSHSFEFATMNNCHPIIRRCINWVTDGVVKLTIDCSHNGSRVWLECSKSGNKLRTNKFIRHFLEQISVSACLSVGLSVNWYIFIVKMSHWISIKLDSEYLDHNLAI